MEYCMIVTEGPHDQAFIGRLLKIAFSFGKFTGEPSKLDPFWKPLVPTYPSNVGNLYTRLPMPSILSNDSISTAVYMAGSCEKIVRYITSMLKLNLKLNAIGIVADSDEYNPITRFDRLRQQLIQYLPSLPSVPGEVSQESPTAGIYVLPDNQRDGTLEDVLLECADIVYGELKTKSQAYLSGVSANWKTQWRGSDDKKAHVGCISNVLRPGKTNQVSIADNDWISSDTLDQPCILQLIDFFKRLLGIPDT